MAARLATLELISVAAARKMIERRLQVAFMSQIAANGMRVLEELADEEAKAAWKKYPPAQRVLDQNPGRVGARGVGAGGIGAMAGAAAQMAEAGAAAERAQSNHAAAAEFHLAGLAEARGAHD